ncbi:hypothetical protein CRI94_15265 [Longibacter salinarum]|uniref:Uncharacterized protein n=2 Tax=Longibacter salinarum TaxID=1850348 RepID=A0A2A8CUG3_9BACT|nr:hypothetical protein CRI94_15265 [Longibacter salinarum]
MTQSSAAIPGGMMPDTSSYTWGVPTVSGEQMGTAIVLATADESRTIRTGSAEAILLYLPGATDPTPGEYDLPNLLMTVAGGGITDPSMSSPFATYTEARATALRMAPAISGTITVERVTSEGVFGSFRFTTVQALTLDFAQPVDSPDDSSFEPEPFATTMDGTFEAMRVDVSQDMLTPIQVQR